MLKLSKLTDYATVVMTVLAEAGRVHSAQELAERAHLELPTVSKLLKQLAHAELRHPLGDDGFEHGEQVGDGELPDWLERP